MPKATELTEEQIQEICRQANHPSWQEPFVHGLATSLTAVTKVSIKTGLIFIGGDESIGVKHILNRHQGGKKHFGKKHYPTEFDFDIAPVTYYELAEKILEHGTCVENEHDHVYESNLQVANSKHTTFKLVLYRDTKIVKSMYPVATQKLRPKYEINYAGKYIHDVLQGIHTIEYRFHDDKKPRFLLLVTFNEFLGTEKRVIYSLKKDGKIYSVIYEKELPTSIDMKYFSFLYPMFKFTDEENFVNNYDFSKSV